MLTPQTRQTNKPTFQAIRVDLLDRLLNTADQLSTGRDADKTAPRKLQ